MTETRLQKAEIAVLEVQRTVSAHTTALTEIKTSIKDLRTELRASFLEMKQTLEGLMKHVGFSNQGGVVQSSLLDSYPSPTRSPSSNSTARSHHRWNTIDWDLDSVAITSRVSANTFADPILDLRKLQQTGSVDAYYRLCEPLLLRAQLREPLSEKQILSFFLGGLDPDIQGHVRGLRPSSLSNALALARLRESSLKLRRLHCPTAYPPPPPPPLPPPCSTSIVPFTAPPPTLSGAWGASPITVIGYIGKKPLVILLDTGSTHNFKDLTLAKKLGCNAVKLPSFKATIANGQAIPCTFTCKDFRWYLHGKEYPAAVLLLPLGISDLIFGPHWLSTFGNIVMHFNENYLQIKDGDTSCTLQELTASALDLSSLDKLDKLLTKGTQVADIHLYSLVVAPQSLKSLIQLNEHKRSQLEPVLHELVDVFQTSIQLPREQPMNHAITLLPRTTPIASRPYRWPNLQNSAIETMVSELLLVSRREYSAAILLLPLENYDLILRAQWFSKFSGDVTINFQRLYLRFANEGTSCTIIYLTDDVVGLTSATKLDKLLLKEEKFAAIHLCSVTVFAQPLEPLLHPDEHGKLQLTLLLPEFDDIFQQPAQLPPTRSMYPVIELELVTLASRGVDCCFIHEFPFYLEGPGGLFHVIERCLKEAEYMVLAIAERASQEVLRSECRTAEKQYASGNRLLHDVGCWLSGKIKDHFSKSSKMVINVKYIDPTYMERWARLLLSTNQASFLSAKDVGECKRDEDQATQLLEDQVSSVPESTKLSRTENVDREYNNLVDASEAAKKVDQPWTNIFQRRYTPQLEHCSLIPSFQQLPCISVIMFYAPVFLKTLGFGSQASLVSAAISGVINVLATFMFVFTVDKFGRRALLLAGRVQMILCQVPYIAWPSVVIAPFRFSFIGPTLPIPLQLGNLSRTSSSVFLDFNLGDKVAKGGGFAMAHSAAGP